MVEGDHEHAVQRTGGEQGLAEPVDRCARPLPLLDFEQETEYRPIRRRLAHPQPSRGETLDTSIRGRSESAPMSKKRRSRTVATLPITTSVRRSGSMGVSAAHEGALAHIEEDMEGRDCRVVKRVAAGDRPDVRQAHRKPECWYDVREYRCQRIFGKETWRTT